MSSKGRRTLPIDKFFFRPIDDATRENTLSAGEIVETVALPAPAEGARSVYRKLKEKESFDWPIVEICVALTMSGGTIRNPRVVFGSVAPTPVSLPGSGGGLERREAGPRDRPQGGRGRGRPAKPLSQNAYKVRLAKVELERALKEVFA